MDIPKEENYEIDTDCRDIYRGRVMVPIRDEAEALGKNVQWNGPKTILRGKGTRTFILGSI
jgi:hypothetical protein